jgi:HD-GYP domain-containing protein (c-di-GMP phosphodiesterase class II)
MAAATFKGLRVTQSFSRPGFWWLADTVEAKTTNRPYRFAKGLVEALEVVSAGKNTLFDGAVVEACLALFREKDYSFPQSLPATVAALAELLD